MRALILAAGLGSRLRPLTRVRAKAAVPVNGDPLIRRIIRWLAAHGICDLVINLHHCPASISAVVGDGSDLHVRVRYSWEPRVLGSAGGPRRALPLLVGDLSSREPFLLVNGDTLTDVDVPALLDVHRTSSALVTMAVIPNPEPDRYGGVIVEQGRVRGFSRPGGRETTYHFVGVQVAEARAFAHLPDGEPAESVMQVYPDLIRGDAGAVAASVVDATFHDIGTPAVYLQTSLELAASEENRLVQSTRIHPTADLCRTVVWQGATIGAGARLEDCIVCDEVEIPSGARYRRAAIARYDGGERSSAERLDGTLVVRSF